MTRKQALTELRDKVAAGAEVTARDASRIWPKGYAHAINAGHGSLDAALALHNAVLPGWDWAITNEGAKAGEYPGPFCIVSPFNDVGEMDITASADTPARAWLLAILSALIAECDG